jgi:hypothetical protein
VETSYYFGPPNPPRKFQCDFFRSRIDPETKNYENEDFYFCTEVRKHGFEVWALASERASHFGTHNFSLNMQALASLGAARIGETRCQFTEQCRKQTPQRPKQQSNSLSRARADKYNGRKALK